MAGVETQNTASGPQEPVYCKLFKGRGYILLLFVFYFIFAEITFYDTRLQDIKRQ